MKTVLVAGAAGGAGEGIVRALLEDDETCVLATSRTLGRLDALRERLDPHMRERCLPIAGDAGDFEGAESIAHRAEALGGFDAAVAILGRGWWSSGPILDLEPAQWRSVLDEMLTAHFAFARAVIPRLEGRAKAVYLSIGGGAAFEPVTGAALMSIAAAGQAMLTRSIVHERGSAPPRVLELVINGPLRTSESAGFAEPGWITAADAGRTVRELVDGSDPSWPAIRVRGPLIVMDQIP